MKTSLLRFSVWFLVIGIFLLAGCASGPTAADVEAAKAAISEIWENYSAFVMKGDSKAWLSQLDEDFIQMPPNSPARGKAEIAKGIQAGWAKRKVLTFNINAEENVIAGDLAYSRGTYDSERVAGGKTSRINGKFLTILKRQPDGSWKIYRDCFNSNVK